jgi:hypothetical protein
MATLNSITSYGDDDEEANLEAAQLDPILTWNWATWPANLRKAAITTLAMLVLVAAAIALARWTDQGLTKKLKSQIDLKTAAQTRLKNSDQERADIDKNIPLLRQLESQGIFGEEKRLEWIEQLRAIEKRWAGVKLQYDISAQTQMPSTDPAGQGTALSLGQTPTAGPALLPSGEAAQSFGMFQTDMKLTLKTLHEGDALAVIAELKAANLGRFNLKQCSFKRPGGAGTPSSAANPSIGPALDVICSLTWISMKTYKPS